MLYKDQIDKNRIPAHIAIIMDGNGRWAKQQGHARTFGHQAGAETVHIIAEEAARLGVKYLTLYTFSTENWNRPVDEVAALMSLLMDSIEEETFMKNNISFRIIGEIDKLPENVLARLNKCIERTSKNTGMCLTLALSYSSNGKSRKLSKNCPRSEGRKPFSRRNYRPDHRPMPGHSLYARPGPVNQNRR